MLSKQLTPALKGFVSRFEFSYSDYARDAWGKLCRKRRMGDGIFERTLWVGSQEADSYGGSRIERVWEGDFARLKPLLINNVFFGSEDQPNGIGN